jgi:hypothetical protein
MKGLSVFGLVVVVLVGIVALPGPAMAQANTSSPAEGQAGFAETQYVVTVYENGSARWTQRYNQPLTNETEIQQFRAYADRLNNEETTVYTDFKQRATELTEEGSNATGREMNAKGFTRNARVTSQPSATGVVEMSFLWTNFTTDDNGRMVVGDAFDNGLYLSPEMSLTIKAGPHLETKWESVAPTPDASTNGSGNTTDSLTYFGEEQFASGHPRVAFVPESAVVVNGSSMFSSPLMWVAGVLMLVLAVALGAVVVRRTDTSVFGTTDDERGTTVTEADGESDTDTETTTETSEAATPTEPAVTDEELLSDKDRVTALLEANGGRMQQGTIVEETGWSKSKVSTLLSEMAEEGRVSKLRVGRENIVSLAGHEPDAAQSPFDDT